MIPLSWDEKFKEKLDAFGNACGLLAQDQFKNFGSASQECVEAMKEARQQVLAHADRAINKAVVEAEEQAKIPF